MRAPSVAIGLIVAGAVGALLASAGCREADPPSPAQSASPSAAPVVDCDRGGTGELPEEARERGIAAGPLLFAYARDLADQSWIVRPQAEMLRELIEDPDTSASIRRRARRTMRALPEKGYGIAQMLVAVEAGAIATVALPESEHGHATLAYTLAAADRERPGAAGVLAIGDGDPAVTFKACPDASTIWNGGLVVAGEPRCLQVDVRLAGRREPLRRQLPIGAGEQCRQGADPASD